MFTDNYHRQTPCLFVATVRAQQSTTRDPTLLLLQRTLKNKISVFYIAYCATCKVQAILSRQPELGRMLISFSNRSYPQLCACSSFRVCFNPKLTATLAQQSLYLLGRLRVLVYLWSLRLMSFPKCAIINHRAAVCAK